MGNYLDVIGNVIALGALSVAISKIVEAVIAQGYAAVFALLEVEEERREAWRKTLFLWAVGLGLGICVYSEIPFMPAFIREPLSHWIAGLITGAGAGVIWDIALDPIPSGGETDA